MLSRFRAYQLYDSHPARRFLKGLGIFLLIFLLPFLLALVLYPLEWQANDISFMQQADRLVIRYDDDFSMMTDLEESLLLPSSVPLDADFQTLSVDDLSIFPEHSFYALDMSGMDEILADTRLAVLFEIDFYAGDDFLGTIRALTPRDSAALQDAQSTDRPILQPYGGHPVAFCKGSDYFLLHTARKVLDDLLTDLPS